MKKLICVFLAFVLVLGLTACGKDKEAAENPTEGISESTTENTVKSTEPVEITPAEAPTSEHSDAESEEKIEEVPAISEQPEEVEPAENDSSSEEMVDGMRVSFKEAMDSYEKFFDEYVAFMKKYQESLLYYDRKIFHKWKATFLDHPSMRSGFRNPSTN